jgi:hypothetical protein
LIAVGSRRENLAVSVLLASLGSRLRMFGHASFHRDHHDRDHINKWRDRR